MASQGHPLECARDAGDCGAPLESAAAILGPTSQADSLGLTYLFALLTAKSLAGGGNDPRSVSLYSCHSSTRPPFWLPRIVINHKCPYDNSAPRHLITKVQPTYETCHSCPFTQKSKQHISDYSGYAYGHFQTPPLQSASTTNSHKPK